MVINAFPMLDWFVCAREREKCIQNRELLGEELVETRPEKVPNCCLDENVNIYHNIKKFFTSDAWQLILQVLEVKRSQDDWSCKVCMKDLHDNTVTIVCDCCLDWYHLACVGLRNAPKRREWFCRFYYDKLFL